MRLAPSTCRRTSHTALQTRTAQHRPARWLHTPGFYVLAAPSWFHVKRQIMRLLDSSRRSSFESVPSRRRRSYSSSVAHRPHLPSMLAATNRLQFDVRHRVASYGGKRNKTALGIRCPHVPHLAPRNFRTSWHTGQRRNVARRSDPLPLVLTARHRRTFSSNTKAPRVSAPC